MSIRSKQVGQSNEYNLLWDILKKLERLLSVIGNVAGNVPTLLSQLTSDSTHRTVTDAEKSTWNSKQTVLYHQYSAFLSQTSTNAPTELGLCNDIGVIALSRTSAGIYTILSSGLFTENKTTPNKLNTFYDAAGNKITIEWTSTTTITLKTYTAADTTVLGDGILDEQEVNIKVFI